MTVISSYDCIVDKAFSAIALPGDTQPGTAPTITALANGGYAVALQDTDNYSDLYVYDAAGTLTWSNSGFDATDAKLTQLTNGNILVLGTVGIHVDYRLFSSSGQLLDANSVNRYNNESNASTTAMKNGGFATAMQTAFAGTDHDIYVAIQSASGVVKNVFLDTTSADDEDPSIATLADGGLVIVWDRTDHSGGATDGNSTLYDEILNADGSVRVGQTLIDPTGSINLQPSVTALANGGFAISYEDNGWDTVQADITEANFDANNNATSSFVRLSNNNDVDSQASTAQLSGGGVATAFTRLYDAPDTDIYFSFYNPVTGETLLNGLKLENSFDIEASPAVTALGNNRFAVAYTDSTNDRTFVGIFEPTRNTTGDNADNAIQGDTLNDAMHGFGGNDLFIPGDGANNTVDGGVGNDTVDFSGARAGYSITRNGLNTIVMRPDGGTDTLTNVEDLHFTDQDVRLAPMVRDLNADGISDMVLQNTNGSIRVWSMNASGALATNAVTTTTPAASWHVIGTGQFNYAADGADDILLQNDNGSMVIWEMNGALVTATANPGSVNSPWKAINTGDFNGDENSDILFRNTTTGQLDIWLMNGTAATTKATVGSALGTAWHVAATADLNGDGKSDIVLQNDSGQISIWLMNGTSVGSSKALSGTAGSGWTVRGAGDFDGGGKADLLLQNAGGALAIWTMNGTTVGTKTGIGSVAATWTAVGTGDFNGDGKADIEFQNTSSAVSEWLMNSTTVLAKQGVGSAPGTAWHLVSATGG